METKHRRWVVYDNTGKVVVLCRDRLIAIKFANSTRVYDSKGSRPPTRQSEDE
jgi:hypothetical protein